MEKKGTKSSDGKRENRRRAELALIGDQRNSCLQRRKKETQASKAKLKISK